jgi:putative nucleotidyltransferase with HDIG domain
MEKIELNKIIKQLDHIPALPKVVGLVLEKLDDPNTSMFELGKIIQSDVAFASKILQIVNSAFYGITQKVSSLGKAITMLGFRTLKSAIIGISIIKSFGSAEFDPHAGSVLDEQSKTFAPEGLWAHSLGVAACARCIAKKVLPSESEEAFIAGLIHDIGKLVIYNYFSETHCKITDIIKDKNILYSVAEKKHLPIFHDEIGYRVANVWNLPESLSTAVLYHHAPYKAPENYRKIVEITHVADIIARSLQIGSGWDVRIPKLEQDAFDNLGFTGRDIDKILKDSLQEYDDSNIFSKVIN